MICFHLCLKLPVGVVVTLDNLVLSHTAAGHGMWLEQSIYVSFRTGCGAGSGAIDLQIMSFHTGCRAWSGTTDLYGFQTLNLRIST